MAETLYEKVTRLRVLCKEPVRAPMGRDQQFPSMAAKHIANEQELVRLRAGLREALALVESLADREESRRQDDVELRTHPKGRE